MIEVLKSKLHCATVTEANLNYMGSITIDEDLLDAANMIAGEKVQIVNNNNGERFETYIIKGKRGSGCVCLNGAAARKVVKEESEADIMMEKMIVGEYRRGRSCVDISIARGLPYSKVYEIVKKNNANINIKV